MASKKNTKNLITSDLIKLGEDAGFISNEAYKRLRTNLIYSLPASDKCKFIGITSSLAGEGKSTTSANLAYSMALTGKKVLLLECDLRKPNLARRLSLTAGSGVSDLLVGEKNNLQEAIVAYNGDASFDVIVAGSVPPNPSELLGSSRMNKILDLLSTAYDYIILDLPPTSVVSDPLVVAKSLNGMIVVVRHNYTDKSVLRNVVNQINSTGVKILGFAYNGSNDFAGKKSKKYGAAYYN